MPTTITSAGITFNDATSLTSAVIPANAVGATQIANGSVTAAKLGTTEQTRIAKAWVNFNGTTSPGTIRSSYNVSSVTKNGTGDYTVNFATAMADANYSYLLSGEANSVNGLIEVQGNVSSQPTTNTLRLNCRMGASIIFDDSARISVLIFGN